MIRVLTVYGEPLAHGGQESFIMNMYRNFDRSAVQLDFYTPYYCDKMLEKEINSLGGVVYQSGFPFGENNPKCFKKGFTDFLKDYKPTICHIQSGSTYALSQGAKIAHDAGVKNIIVHSHCCGLKNLKYHVIKALSVHDFKKYPTEYFACSTIAGEWKFPKSIMESGKCKILKNAVDTSDFYYDATVRKETRAELGLSDSTLAVGHVGRFNYQKNHMFLVDIFAEVHKKQPDSKLFLTGEGELLDDVKKKVSDLSLDDAVVFLGIRKDVFRLMNAFDVFLLPSLFEGLPVVGVESLATGLPLITSTAVTDEMPVQRLTAYLSLDDTADAWADAVINATKAERKSTTDEIIEAGYDVKSAAAHLQHLYEEMA